MKDLHLEMRAGGGARVVGGRKSVLLSSKETTRIFENFRVLVRLAHANPGSIYALAKACSADTANTRKLVAFFERCGLVEFKSAKVGGRITKIPALSFRRIVINPLDISAAGRRKRAGSLVRNSRR